MARDSRTQRLPENFYSSISHDPNPQTMRPSSIPSKLSQFHRDHSKKPPADVVIPVNNSSVMQSFRKNFVNELQELTLPTRTSCVSQKRISEYFPEVKSVEPTSCTQGARTKKRSLQELKMKYDSVQNMVANLSKDATCTEQVLVESETVTRAKRSRSSTQNENAIVPTSSKSHNMVPVTAKSQATAKKVKNEQETPYTPTFIHLVGYVDNILRWSHILKNSNIFVVYNVLGYFISCMEGIHSKEKFVYIRSNTGIILECSYFEIDRPVPMIRKDQFVGCFGHLIGAQRFRLFSIDVIDDTQSNDIRRLLYLSQRVTHELSNKFN